MAGRDIVCYMQVALVCVLSGCSNDVTDAGRAGQARSDLHSADPPPAARSPCDVRVVTAQDVAGILSETIIGTKPVPGDAQSCEFFTSGFAGITVTVRPGLGRETVEEWSSGKMPLTAIALPGIGDSAVWQPDLHEVIAQKNNLLCDIQARGLSRDSSGEPVGAGGVAQKKMGAVCNKIFNDGNRF